MRAARLFPEVIHNALTKRLKCGSKTCTFVTKTRTFPTVLAHFCTDGSTLYRTFSEDVIAFLVVLCYTGYTGRVEHLYPILSGFTSFLLYGSQCFFPPALGLLSGRFFYAALQVTLR